MFVYPATRGHGWELGVVSPVLGWFQSDARPEGPLVWDLNEEEAGGLRCLLTHLFSIQHLSTFLSACWNQVRLSVSISLEKESLVVFRNRRSIAPWLPWVCLGPVILGSHCILYKVWKNIPLFSATGFTTTFLGTWSFLFLSRSVVVNKVASSFPLASTGHSDLVLAPLVLCLFLQLPPICSPRDLRFPMHPLLMQGGFSVAFFFLSTFGLGWSSRREEVETLCTSP